jgi:long-chain acyl-CoA synthetase
MSETIYGTFIETAIKYPDKVALRYKKQGHYSSITYKELRNSIDAVADELQKSGVRKGTTVGIFSYNRPEWIIADMAIMKLGGVVVPIYHTLSSSSVKYIINDSKIKLIFVENTELFSSIQSSRNETPELKKIILFDDSHISRKNNIIKFSGIQKTGRQSTKEDSTISGNEIATIVYTSGTTGNPKGVVLSHHNILSNTSSITKRYKITSEDVSLSYLPLTHMFERTCGYYTILLAGGSIGFAEGLSTVMEDIKKINPTILLVVPRVTEKAYEKVAKEIKKSSKIKKAVLNSTIRNLNEYANLKYKQKKIPFRMKMICSILNKLVASKLRKLAGNRLKVIVSGGAPLDPKIAKVFYILGFNIVEGYGLTETSPVVCSNTIENNILGTVGKPLDGVEIKIGENDEILVIGPNVMQGYYNKPEETERVIDKEGYFHTGDRGKFDKNGNVIITGRIKEIIVTSYGKNITPKPIEIEIEKSNYINNVILYGNGKKFITALILPEENHIKRYAKESNMLTDNYTELLKNTEIKKLVANEIEKLTAHFENYEKVKEFILLPEKFTVENGMLTPTFKLRKHKIIEKYRNEIDSMYLDSP